jgi:multidrug resistance protein, MATE family
MIEPAREKKRTVANPPLFDGVPAEMNGSAREPDDAGSLRELIRVSIPLILSAGSMMLMHFIDRMYLTWYSEETLAASLPASLLAWTVASIGIGTVSYVNSFVSQYHGANRPEKISSSIWQAIYLGLWLSVLTLLLSWLSWHLIPYFGHEARVTELEQEFFSLLCFATIPSILSSGLSAFYSGRGETTVVMLVNMAMVALNTVLDYAMIFGWGPIPRMGIRGAGWATLITLSFGMCCYLAMLCRRRERIEFRFWKSRRFDGELIRRMTRYGLPNGFQMLGDALSFMIFMMLVGRLGKTELAATNLAFNLNMLVFIPMLGMGTAVTILVGQRIGEGRSHLGARSTWLAFAVTGGWTLLFAAGYLTLPDLILEPFRVKTDPAEFARLEPVVKSLLIFIAVYSLFDALMVIFGSAIRAAGDTRFSLLMTLLSGWLVMVLPVAVMELTGNLTLRRCWYACSTHIIFLGVLFLLRFLYGPWRTMKVIEDDPIPESHLPVPHDVPPHTAESGHPNVSVSS